MHEQDEPEEVRSWLAFVYFSFALLYVAYLLSCAAENVWLIWIVFPAMMLIGTGLMLIRNWISGVMTFLIGMGFFFQSHPYVAAILAMIGVLLVLASFDKKAG